MGYWGANDVSSYANQNWTRNNKFWIEPTFEKGAKLESIIRPAISDLKSFNACIIDINLYDSVADPIEQYINEEYVIGTINNKIIIIIINIVILLNFINFLKSIIFLFLLIWFI